MRSLLLATILPLILLAGCDLPQPGLRVATFNIAMGLREQGDMARALQAGDDERLQQVAGILQRVRPDIVLLNEFDFDESVDAAGLFNDNYLSRSPAGLEPIDYPWHFRAPVNTGVPSGLDLDGDGKIGGPGDSWGFGYFPGQYGMLVLSRYPLRPEKTRTFREFRWSALPGAARPVHPDGRDFFPDETWSALRLSSKSHWDLVFDIDGEDFHLLAFHPTPPVFDGEEDRNGRRNHDEIRFWRDYTDPGRPDYMTDDEGARGGIAPGARFVVAGDFNADPLDGDSAANAFDQLGLAPWIDDACQPRSAGGAEAARRQGGVNTRQRGDPASDTADFNDRRVGNLRLDHLLPSRGLELLGCGVFWPAEGRPGHAAALVSDHRLVWLDIRW